MIKPKDFSIDHPCTYPSPTEQMNSIIHFRISGSNPSKSYQTFKWISEIG